MTEKEWLSSSDLEHLLHGLVPTLSNRKFRLFAAACGRSILSEFRRERVDAEATLDLAERYADQLVSLDDLKKGYDMKRNARESGWYAVQAACCPYRYQNHSTDFSSALAASRNTIGFTPTAWVKRNSGQRLRSKGAMHAIEVARVRLFDLLRCIVGNPFRPVTFTLSWRSGTAVSLATGIYAERAFDRLPILADALEEAGCDDVDVLSHCRGPGPHARGCWVVDGVLEKV